VRCGGRRALLFGVLVLLSSGCTPAEWRPRNIVLVSIDTLRADHLGSYGYPLPTSPFIDGLAERGVVFVHGFAAASTTVPSHATLLTGLHPTQHRVRRNGQQLPGAAVLLTGVLAEQGFETAAFVSTNGHFGASGLDRGFSHFDEPGGGRATPARSAKRTVDFAGDWLRARTSDAPLFLFIHVFDPHSPYRPGEPLRPVGPARSAHADFLTREHHVGTKLFGGSEELMLELMERYDGEIRAVDAELRKLHRVLTRIADPAETLWIVTADHGEGLGNHDWLLHGKKIYNEQLRVPLIFHAEGRLSPARIDAIASHIDVYPTVLELVGAKHRLGDPALLGRSLVSELFGRATPERERFVVSERRTFARSGRADGPRPASGPLSIEQLTRDAVHDNYEPGESYAIQSRRHKLIRNTELGSELFDLESDPYETRNLAGTRPELEQELSQRLTGQLERLRASALPGTPEPVDAEARRALEALGYIDR